MSDNEFLDLGPAPRQRDRALAPRRDRRRRLVGRLVAGFAVVVVIVVVRSTASHHTAKRAGPSAPPALAVDLGPSLCPPHRTCRNPATSADVRAGIEAAVRRVYGATNNLRIRNVTIAVGSPPRQALFAREIRAHTPHGELDVIVAALKPDHSVQKTVPHGEYDAGARVASDGYLVDGDLSSDRDAGNNCTACSTTRGCWRCRSR